MRILRKACLFCMFFSLLLLPIKHTIFSKYIFNMTKNVTSMKFVCLLYISAFMLPVHTQMYE